MYQVKHQKSKNQKYVKYFLKTIVRPKDEEERKLCEYFTSLERGEALSLLLPKHHDNLLTTHSIITTCGKTICTLDDHRSLLEEEGELEENERVQGVVKQLFVPLGTGAVNLGDFLEAQYKKGKQGLPGEWVKWVAREIFKGVAAIHERDLFLEGLKCRDVIITTVDGKITGNSKVQIAEFNFIRKLSREEGTQRIPRSLLTTLSLMNNLPPENNPETSFYYNEGERVYDGEKAASWSLGCVLYKIFSGHEISEEKAAFLDFITSSADYHIRCKKLRQNFLPENKRGYWESIDLLAKLLDPNPETRISVSDALKEKFFEDATGGPYPSTGTYANSLSSNGP